MELYKAIEKRHCVRKFQPSEINRETLLRIADAGRQAPSGCNMQNREFILIQDREILNALHEKIQPDFKNAAAAIAVVMDTSSTKWGEYWKEDAAAATQNMLLAIAAEGYDSVWIEGTIISHLKWAEDLLNIPEDRTLFILIPIGKAAKSDSQGPEKRNLKDMVFYDRYGK